MAGGLPSVSRPPLAPLCLRSQCVYGGVLRGTGKQAFGAIVNAVMYYVVGLPLGIILTFVVRMRIMGMCREGRSEEAWGPSDTLSPRLLVSRRPLAGHAGLWPPGRCCLCRLHRPDGLEARCRGSKRGVGPGLAKRAERLLPRRAQGTSGIGSSDLWDKLGVRGPRRGHLGLHISSSL